MTTVEPTDLAARLPRRQALSARIDEDRALYIGVDVGATKVAVVAVADDDAVLGSARTDLTSLSSQPLVEAICQTVDRVLTSIPSGHARLAAIGIGVPGWVDRTGGSVRLAVNISFGGIAIGPTIGRRFGVPWAIDNDVRAAALGITRWPGASLPPDFAYVNVGTGIAACITLEGRVHRGRRGVAGEIGHVVVEPGGPLCKCGLSGCAEALAAGPAIIARARALLRRNGKSALSQYSELRASDVLVEASKGDHVAARVARQVGRVLGHLAHLLVLTYDVDEVIFGGGVAAAGDALRAAILEDVERRRTSSPLARSLLTAETIRVVDSNLIPGWGAAALARQLPPAGTKGVRPGADCDAEGHANRVPRP